MKEFFTRLIATLAFTFSAVVLFAQIPNDSPVPVDVIVEVPGTGTTRTLEYASVTNSTEWGVQPVRQTVSGELMWVRDDMLDSLDNLDSLGCDTTSMVDAYAGKIAVIRRGACFFSDKLFFAQKAGAIGAFIVNAPGSDGLGGMSAGDERGLEVTMPCAFLDNGQYDFFIPPLDAGEIVIGTFRVRGFFGALGPYAYSTPESQILPMDEIQSTLLNIDTANTLLDVMGTVEITDPDGMMTTLTSTIDSLKPDSTGIFQFDDYVPTIQGIYSMVYTNSVTTDTISREFKIDDFTFSIDNNDIPAWPTDTWIASTNEGFVEDNLVYDFGAFYLTGPDGGTATHVTFALGNPDSLFTGYEDADVFTIIIIDADSDDDGVGPIGGEMAYEDVGPIVGFGAYILNGEETEYQLLDVELDEPLELKPNGQYLVMVQYNGVNAGLGIPPWYVYGGDDEYPYFSELVFTDQLYTAGWAGQFNGLIRLHMNGFVSDSDDVALAPSQVTVQPNPVSDLVNLQFDLDAVADEVAVAIIDISGKVLQMERYSNVLDNTLEFNVSNYPAGTYFFAIRTPDGYSTEKFVIIK